MSARPAMALGADALTSSRALFGPVLAALIGVGRLSAAALVLGVAWLSDALDGRLARASGSIPLPVAALVLVGLGSAFLALRNPALGMAVQAIGYGAFLWRLWAERVAAGWVPVVVAAGIGLFERRRFVHVVLPAFFRGVASVLRRRRNDTFRLPE